MLGFEIEVDLAVSQQDGTFYNGEHTLAISTIAPGFKIVTDNRPLDDDSSYSNLEFVSEAVNVVGGAYPGCIAVVHGQVGEIKRVNTVLYQAGPGSLAGLEDTLKLTPYGSTTVLRPDTGYVETGTLVVHYSVGLPLGGMPAFFKRLSEAAPVLFLPKDEDRRPALIRDRFSLRQAQAFAARECQDFAENRHGAPARDPRTVSQLEGYLQLAYMQICAVADGLDYGASAGTIVKNLTAVLCRSSFDKVALLLPPAALGFLARRVDDPQHSIIDVLAQFQASPEPGFTRRHAFRGDAVIATVRGKDLTLREYARLVLTGQSRVDPEDVFGGMREITVHAELSSLLVPMELRSLGNERKSWTDVRVELGNLCTWADEAFRLG